MKKQAGISVISRPLKKELFNGRRAVQGYTANFNWLKLKESGKRPFPIPGWKNAMDGFFQRPVKRIAGAVALAFVLSLPAVAYALSVAEAKQQGLVAETGRGYLRVQKQAAGVGALVDQTNRARKAKYRQIAKEHGVDLGVVEGNFGKKLGGP